MLNQMPRYTTLLGGNILRKIYRRNTHNPLTFFPLLTGKRVPLLGFRGRIRIPYVEPEFVKQKAGVSQGNKGKSKRER